MDRVSGLVNFLEQIKMTDQSISDTVAELNSREEKLFVKLLERVSPYLDPIAVKVLMRASGEFPEEKDFLEDDKGVLIWDNFSVEEEDSPSYGSYAGEQIWLLTSGKLVQLTRTGTWEPGNCEWTAEATPISTEGAIAQFYLSQAVDSLMAAVDKTLHKQESKQRKLADRLKFIESVENLLS